MIDSIFLIVQKSLEWIAKKTQLTYKEVNIILYYFLIPITWTLMIDYVFRLPFVLSIVYCLFSVIVFLSCKNLKKFCDRLFNKSTYFIESFGNYYTFSVVLCVAVPIVIYIVLGVFVYYHYKVYN
jgi:hypothetical protein